MTAESTQKVTQLLLAWKGGDEAALQSLIPLVHAELRRLAKRAMARERPDHTLRTTALVNETYLRLIDAAQVQWQGRAHFFAIAARLMRRVLVDLARTRGRLKRGGDVQQVALDEAMIVSQERDHELVALDDALGALAAFDERKGQVVELRYFGGLSVEETAEVLSISAETVMRDWKVAKAWLLRELSTGKPDEA